MKTSIKQVTTDLTLIKLTPPISGFYGFIGVWLYKTDDFTILIDVGPSTTFNQLKGALSHLKINHLDYIVLTHIHLDHAGAIGQVATLLNKPTIICHKKGIPHLVNPKKLWNGSIKNLGKIANIYGKPLAVEKKILTSSLPNINKCNIQVIETPGHSPHHISIIIGKYFFIGEAAGILLYFNSKNIYMRPATPPFFFVKTYLKSLSIIKLKLKSPFKFLCYGHLSIIHKKHKTIQQHFKQINLWKDIIGKIVKINKIKNSSLIKLCFKEILGKDPLLVNFNQMNSKNKAREIMFLKNSIKGFIGDIINNTN